MSQQAHASRIMLEKLPNTELRNLKARAQKLNPVVKLGKNGVSEAFLASVNKELDTHQLIKIKFTEFKERKKELPREIADATKSHVIQRVGHVCVLYRAKS